MEKRVLGVCDAVGAFIEYWGFKATYGRIWALLALHKRPLSQVNISRKLGVSRSLVSGSIAELTDLGLVRPVRSGRNAPFEAVINVWPTISEVLRSREWMLIESTRLALESALDEAEAMRRRGEDSPFDHERIRFLLSLTDIAQGFVRVLVRMRNAPSADALTRWTRKAIGLVRRFSG